MTIHIVQPGETLYTIAELYGVSAIQLIKDNEIETPYDLVTGQTIVIVYPAQVYTVKERTTLKDIAITQDVSLNQLLRNNPYLYDRTYIYPGETIVISFNQTGLVSTNGYANTFIERNTLTKTLPFLTYLSIFGHRTTQDSIITGIDNEDSELIKIAKEYGVASIMLLSTLDLQGKSNYEAEYKIIYIEELSQQHIDNILNILNTKGYTGLNITLQFINKENVKLYETYISKLSKRLNEVGFTLFVTIIPNTIYTEKEIIFERIDYSVIGQMANGITIINYNWGYSFGPPGPVGSILIIKEFLDYIITMIPPEKISIGLPILGYDWALPYILGYTKANVLTLESAISLARYVDAVIQFDETSQTPFFKYVEKKSGIPIEHIVWFIDARSIDALLKTVTEYGLNGTGFWNIMTYYSQMWLVINSQYGIETVLPE